MLKRILSTDLFNVVRNQWEENLWKGPSGDFAIRAIVVIILTKTNDIPELGPSGL